MASPNAECRISVGSLLKAFLLLEGLHLRRRSFDFGYASAQDDNVEAVDVPIAFPNVDGRGDSSTRLQAGLLRMTS